MLNKFIEFLMLFVLIFSFKVPIIGYSSLLLLTILILGYIFNYKTSKNNLVILLNSKNFYKIVFTLFIIILFTFLYTIIHGAYDFTMIPTLLNQFINLIIVLLYISVFHNSNKSYLYYFELVVYCFSLQSLIMLLTLTFPAIKQLVELTQDSSVIERSLISYGGMRNLAFGSTQFFGLNASMGIAIVLNAFLIVIKKNSFHVVTYLLIAIGIFLSGRTSLLAILISLVYLMLNLNLNINKNFKFLFFLLILTLCIPLGLGIFRNFIPESVILWAFEFYYNYENTGEFSSNSSDHLIQNMYFMPDTNTFLFGTGKYTNIDGSYYMHTDAGFMRLLLYFGVFGIFLFSFYFLLIQTKIFSYLSFFCRKKFAFQFTLCIMLISFIYNVKGEFLGFLIMSQNIFFLIMLSLLIGFKKKYQIV